MLTSFSRTFTLAFRAIRLVGIALGVGLSAFTAYQRRQAQMDAAEGPHGRHLDATADREVVFCHACFSEWYRDEHGLICPACDSDVTEIVDAQNDPREYGHASSGSGSPPPFPHRYDDFSDPEEADIDEFSGPHGFVQRRSVIRNRRGQNPAHHDPEVEPVLHRFYEMLENFGRPRGIHPNEVPNQDGHGAVAWPRMHRTTFTTGPGGGGTASVTIFSGPSMGRPPMAPGPDGSSPPDAFQAFFSHALGNMGPPGDQQGGPAPNFARGLQEILNLLSPANAVAGDAVYSQEALDRIITQLMEANPQSNAAPPASEEALRSLERTTVSSTMLRTEGRTECTICLDELKVGEQATFLPCKHWFHEECVILWLKEHNTCPICRTSIETGGGGGQDGKASAGSSQMAGDSQPPVAADGGSGGQPAPPTVHVPDAAASRPALGARPMPAGGWRTTAISGDGNARERGSGTGRQPDYDASSSRRRTSISPSSPRQISSAAAEMGSRMRQRSPSNSSRRGGPGDEAGRRASQGAIGWLRDRFSGGSGSPRGEPRDERRT